MEEEYLPEELSFEERCNLATNVLLATHLMIGKMADGELLSRQNTFGTFKDDLDGDLYTDSWNDGFKFVQATLGSDAADFALLIVQRANPGN